MERSPPQYAVLAMSELFDYFECSFTERALLKEAIYQLLERVIENLDHPLDGVYRPRLSRESIQDILATQNRLRKRLLERGYSSDAILEKSVRYRYQMLPRYELETFKDDLQRLIDGGTVTSDISPSQPSEEGGGGGRRRRRRRKKKGKKKDRER